MKVEKLLTAEVFAEKTGISAYKTRAVSVREYKPPDIRTIMQLLKRNAGRCLMPAGVALARFTCSAESTQCRGDFVPLRHEYMRGNIANILFISATNKSIFCSATWGARYAASSSSSKSVEMREMVFEAKIGTAGECLSKPSVSTKIGVRSISIIKLAAVANAIVKHERLKASSSRKKSRAHGESKNQAHGGELPVSSSPAISRNLSSVAGKILR